MSGHLSTREVARQIGVDEKAIRKGMRSGRLKASVSTDEKGRQFVHDVALAKQEWVSNSGHQARTPRADRSANSSPQAQTPDTGTVIPVETLNEAQRQATVERARKLRLENDLAEGRLVPVAQASKEAFEAARTIRESLLNLPARLSGELAAETDASRVYIRLDAAVREALEEASDRLLATVNE